MYEFFPVLLKVSKSYTMAAAEDNEISKSPLTSSQDLSIKHAPGIDAEVADFFAQSEVSKAVVIDQATNVRLRWMIHKRVLTVMVITYFTQALDKGTINFASIMGIREDTNLVGQEYAWLTTCGLWSSLLIASMANPRLEPCVGVPNQPSSTTLSNSQVLVLQPSIMAWGVVLACTAACKNFVGLVVVRTLLGIFECICQPAFVFMSTMWYTREEQALVIGSFYSMNGFQQCVGGLIAYGIAQLLGCLTFVWGLFVLWWLPDSPMRANCFSPEDRLLMVERVRKNDTGVQNKKFKMHQAREALQDITVWGIVLISFTNALPTGGLGAFSNIILKAFGFTQLQTYLLAIAQGVIIMLFLFSAAYLSKQYNQRLFLAFIYTLPNVAGTIVFLSVPTSEKTKVGLLLAFYCTQGFGAVAVLNLAVMSGNVAGRTKQAVASTLVFVAWAVGNAIGPQGYSIFFPSEKANDKLNVLPRSLVFRETDAPRYVKAFVAHIVVYGIQLATIFLLRLHLMRQNVLKRRAQGIIVGEKESDEGVKGADEHIEHRHAFDDLTDRENPDFRYVY
ncbi:hypothetical protein NLJ89_g435 [Agrocybe chaxingu]|uniref:Uncharacterized protein n=1 Tax=Agrocybe chaxingu TaxID=84603 RepID=A0A9W8N1X2_9AGAR|nr:hypothetical protein NLJ89_g435 [Agrocybe chaxingu]